MNPVQTSNTVAHPTQIAQDAVMTAYSLTGNLSSATALCRALLDEDLPAEDQAMAVLVKLHNIAMLRPKHCALAPGSWSPARCCSEFPVKHQRAVHPDPADIAAGEVIEHLLEQRLSCVTEAGVAADVTVRSPGVYQQGIESVAGLEPAHRNVQHLRASRGGQPVGLHEVDS